MNPQRLMWITAPLLVACGTAWAAAGGATSLGEERTAQAASEAASGVKKKDRQADKAQKGGKARNGQDARGQQHPEAKALPASAAGAR